MRHIYDATINGDNLTLSARDMRAAHKAVMAELKRRVQAQRVTETIKTTVSIVRRGSNYPPHVETI